MKPQPATFKDNSPIKRCLWRLGTIKTLHYVPGTTRVRKATLEIIENGETLLLKEVPLQHLAPLELHEISSSASE